MVDLNIGGLTSIEHCQLKKDLCMKLSPNILQTIGLPVLTESAAAKWIASFFASPLVEGKIKEQRLL